MTRRGRQGVRNISRPQLDPTAGNVPEGDKCIVLDTSVLLADPRALQHFAENHVVIPLAVVDELEAKRVHPELGYAARAALRKLEELRLANKGRVIEPMLVNDHGGTLQIIMDESDDPGDVRILVAARALAVRHRVVLVSNDLPLRLKASGYGLDAEEYRAIQSYSGWTGFETLEVTDGEMDELHANRRLFVDRDDLIVHTGLIITSGTGSTLGRVTGRGEISLVDGNRAILKGSLKGRSAEQRIALDALLDDTIGIVSLGGRAGTGKSALAICAGLEGVFTKRYKKVTVFRPIYAVGGQDLGALPGTAGEKMSPWGQAVWDTIESTLPPQMIVAVKQGQMLEVLPLTHIRGRTLFDTFAVIDEAQQLERHVLLTALSRLGRRSRVVLTHDVAQRDNLHVGRHDGISAVIDLLKGHDLFAHYTMVRSERSAIAELVTELLDI